MRRFIITGAPGAGKTAIVRQLELDGFSVVEEAATDVIAAAQARGSAEPWTDASFVDKITKLQRQRQIRASYQPDEIQFHDRSAVCTAALAVYLGYPVSSTLAQELERIETEAMYQKRVFFIRNLGFVRPTEARRISFEEALRFEQIHGRDLPALRLRTRISTIRGVARPGQHNQSSSCVTRRGQPNRHRRLSREIARVCRWRRSRANSAVLAKSQEQRLGMHLTLLISGGLRDGEIAARAAQRNLWLSAFSISYTGNAPRQGFVLGFGNTPAARIPGAVLPKKLLKS